LLEKGADVNAKTTKKTKEGETALMWASRIGRNDNVIVLLDYGADVNAESESGETALISAARWPHGAATVKTLLKNGADFNAKNDKAQTALMIAEKWATTADFPDTINLLKKAMSGN